jgi:hypothetical protein
LNSSYLFTGKEVPFAADAMKNLRSLIGFFESSTQATQKLLKWQKESLLPEYKDKTPVKFLQDVPTRWWSSERSIDRALQLRKAVGCLIAIGELENVPFPSPNDWSLLEEIHELLSTMSEFQKTMEGECYVTGSLSIVAVHQIRKSFVKFINNDTKSSAALELAKVLLKDLDERFRPEIDGRVQYLSSVTTGRYNRHITLHPYFFLASYLDPRVRPLLPQMLTASGLRNLENDLLSMMEIEYGLMENDRPVKSLPAVDLTSNSTPIRATILFAGLEVENVEGQNDDLDEEAVMNEIKSELTFFKKEATMPLTTADGYSNPLDWWRKNAYKFPFLARLARKLLAIPASSAPSERVWSRVSTVLTAKRARMKSEVAADIMYIRENLVIMRKHYVEIALRERGEIDRMMIELEKKYLPPVVVDETALDLGK